MQAWHEKRKDRGLHAVAACVSPARFTAAPLGGSQARAAAPCLLFLPSALLLVLDAVRRVCSLQHRQRRCLPRPPGA